MPKPAEVTLPSDREVRVTRTFNAPRQLVWDAHTKPELVRIWQCGYDGWDMPVCDMDVRVGGKYRWQWRSREDGKQFGFFGTYTEVDGPSKIVTKNTSTRAMSAARAGSGAPCQSAIPASGHSNSVSRTASRRSSAI